MSQGFLPAVNDLARDASGSGREIAVGLIDLDQVGSYEPGDFWEPVRADRGRIILDPGAFYASVRKVIEIADAYAERNPGAPELVEVRIVAMQDNVYFAELVFDGDLRVSSRSSDAIALALRVGCPIVGAEEVLEAGGVPVPDEDEDEVEKFREFLDQITPEDFEAAGPEDPGPEPPSR